MNLKTLLVCALLVGCLSIGFATAVVDPTPSPTQQIDATVGSHTVTITAPDNISGWAIYRDDVNIKNVGPVLISTSRPHPFQMKLSVAGTFDGWVFEEPLWISTDETVGEETGWNNLSKGMYTTEAFPAQSTPRSIPIWLKQGVVDADVNGPRTLVLTYTLSVTTPSPP